MDRLTLQTFADKEAVSQAAAVEVARCAKEAIAERGKFAMALSGGSTPKRLYEILAASPWKEQIDWSKVELFWGDERSVPPDHSDSNYRMASEAMIQKIPIPDGQVHRMEAEREDREAAAAEYQSAIQTVLGNGDQGVAVFDLILLGMGPDAHTASLFPGSDALKVTDKWVTPNFVEKFDTYRMTFTRSLINAANEVLFLVAGEDKAEPLFEVFTGPSDPNRLPSQLIRPKGQLVWYVDTAAIAKMVDGIQGAGEKI